MTLCVINQGACDSVYNGPTTLASTVLATTFDVDVNVTEP